MRNLPNPTTSDPTPSQEKETLEKEALEKEAFEKEALEKKALGQEPPKKVKKGVVFNNFIIHSFIIYIITNIENKRYYIGYSTNGEERKDNHSSRLFSGIHLVTDLQKDYNSLRDRGLDLEEHIVFDVAKTLYLCGPYPVEFVEFITRSIYDMEQKMI